MINMMMVLMMIMIIMSWSYDHFSVFVKLEDEALKSFRLCRELGTSFLYAVAREK